MNEILRGSILLLFCLVVPSCGSNVSNEYLTFTKSLEVLDEKLLDEGEVIIIPGEGCGGCIKNATYHVMNGIDTLKGQVVFTGVGDMKLFRLQVGDLIENPKVIVDRRNLLMNPDYISIYPIIANLKDRQIESVTVYNPQF